MSQKPTSIVRTEVISPDLERLEALITEFIGDARKLMVEDHKKIDIVYDFLFLGQPTADPPVQPFVAQVQSSLASHESYLSGLKSFSSRLFWVVVGVLIGAVGWFVGNVLPIIFQHPSLGGQ